MNRRIGKLIKETSSSAEDVDSVAKGLRWSSMLSSSMRSVGSAGGGGGSSDNDMLSDDHPTRANTSVIPPRNLDESDDIFLSPFVTATAISEKQQLQPTSVVTLATETKKLTSQPATSSQAISSGTIVACDVVASTYRVDTRHEGDGMNNLTLSERRRGSSPSGDVSQKRHSPASDVAAGAEEGRESDQASQSCKTLSTGTSKGSLPRLVSRSFKPSVDDNNSTAGYVPSAGTPLRYVPSPKDTPMASPRLLTTHNSQTLVSPRLLTANVSLSLASSPAVILPTPTVASLPTIKP